MDNKTTTVHRQRTSRQSTSPFQDRHGLSMTEVLVAIAVIGLLLSILVPAIQSVRASSRRAQCLSHVRQLKLALDIYHDTWNVFPDNHKVWLRLLPALGHPDLENFPRSIPTSPIAVFQCPANPTATNASIHFTVNCGTGHLWLESCINGMFGLGFIGYSSITDGLSNTVLFSERKHFPTATENASYLPQSFRNPNELDQYADLCEKGPWTPWTNTTRDDTSGRYYFEPMSGHNHIVTPGHRACSNGPSTDRLTDSYPQILPASSHHSAGVNIMLADGSGRFVNNNVSRSIWRALGTRAASDTVSAF